jgi:phosphatidyl-myo-inositol dimannoside synthase
VAGHLLVTNDFPPKTGGIQAYLFELWRRLEPGRVAVLTATSHPDAANFDSTAPMVIKRVPASTLYLPTPRARAAVVAAIERHQPDLVLFDPAWPLGLLGPTLSRPYGVVLHGAEVAAPGRLPLAAASLRYVLRYATVAVCAGAYPEAEARRNAAEWMPPVVQVPPGVDTARFAPLAPERRGETRRELGLPEDAALVSSYSRLVPRKGMDTLIRASLFVQRAEPRLHLAIGGTGRDRGRLEKMAKALRAPVTFLGRVPDDRVGALLGASDLMVMDCRSRWLGLEQEGFGIVFLEAAACGVAQVAGRSGGSHEPVRHGISGLVVADPRSEQSLATAIAELLGDDERRRRYGAQARELAVRHFEWDALASRLGDALIPFDHFEASNQLA